MSFIMREYTLINSNIMQHKSDQHTMAMLSLRKLVKPLLRMVKKKKVLQKTLTEVQVQNHINSSLEDMRKDLTASCDNEANEQLEQRLHYDLRHCPSKVALIIQQGQQQSIVPVHHEQSFIPVHFARTSNGTFFWTSIDGAHHEELQMRKLYDRWVQA